MLGVVSSVSVLFNLCLLLSPEALGSRPYSARRFLSDGADKVPRSQLELCVARHGEDISWVDELLYAVSVMEDGDGLELHTVRRAAGKETPKYLAYIVEAYDDLPGHIVFLHAERDSWHNKAKVDLLRRLRWQELGFASLRPRAQAAVCSADDMIACEWDGDWFYPVNIPEPQMGYRGKRDLRIEREWSIIYSLVWRELYASELGPLPEVIHSSCCGEFVVARERILAHPKAFYEHLLAWIEEHGTSENTGPMEYMWAQLFGEPAVTHPLTECELTYCEFGCEVDGVHCSGSPQTNES